jgi:hypothetical protein
VVSGILTTGWTHRRGGLEVSGGGGVGRRCSGGGDGDGGR